MQTNEFVRRSLKLPIQNSILAALSKPVLEDLAPHLSRVDLPQGQLLIKSEHEIQWLYFLERGMASINGLDRSGTPLEVGIIGREGIVGVQALLGHPVTRNATVMQGAGEGYRIRADVMREQMRLHRELLQPVSTFLYALIEQTAQLVLCNRLHELEARMARWLLTTCDFMGTSAIHLTQEFMAEMLGVGRPAVTLAAGVMQRSGLIVYRRGLVEVVNSKGLQGITCECYQQIKQAYRRAYPNLY